MENQTIYLAFDVLESLKTRDSRKVVDGLNKLRTALKSEDGIRILGQLAEATPNLEEFIIIWDHPNKAQEYHVSITLMQTMADIFHVASLKNCASAAPAAVSAAASLAAALIPRRLRNFYSHLASQQRNRASAALLLLAALVGLGSSFSRELVRVFDFGLAALPQLARPLRGRKGETTAETAIRQKQEWASSDPLKRPTRAAFITLCLALLKHSDVQLLPEVLRLRPLVGGVLHNISNDPPKVQLEVLQVLQKRVFAPKSVAAIGSSVQAEIFSDAALNQLSAVCAAGEDAESEEHEENASEKPMEAVVGGATESRQASDLSFFLLRAICVDPAHGLCITPESATELSSLQFSAAGALTNGQRRLLRLMQKLRPAESARHGEVLRACTTTDPALAAAMLLSLHYAMEPMPTGRWLVHAGVVGSLVQSVAGVSAGLVELAERGMPPPELGGRSMQAALRCILPPALPRAALSRGVQHNNALARHAVLCLLGHMLTALHALLSAATAATLAVPFTSSATLKSQWQQLLTGLQHSARAALPDLQPLIAQLSLAATAGTKTQETPTKKAKTSKENEDMEIDEGDLEESLPDKQGVNLALFSATLQCLRLWRRCLPSSFTESNVDVEKLVPEDLSSLHPLHQLQFIELLDVDRKDEEPQRLGGSLAGPGPALLPVLRVISSKDGLEEVKNAAVAWSVVRLKATGLFEANLAEPYLWIDLLPGSINGAESAFLNDAVGLVLRRPGDFYSLVLDAVEQQQPEMSLLALCALRQALRVLSSDKKSLEEKTAIAQYVCRVAVSVVLQEPTEASSAAAAVLLGVLSSEAARSENGKDAAAAAATQSAGLKRKVEDQEESIRAVRAMLQSLGPAAEQIKVLADWLGSFAQATGSQKKSKKSKKESNRNVISLSSLSEMISTFFPEVESAITAASTNHSSSPTEGSTATADIKNYLNVLLKQLPLCLLPVACLQSVSIEASDETAKVLADLVALRVSSTPYRAELVVRQVLHIMGSLPGDHAMHAVLCAVLRGTMSAVMERIDQEIGLFECVRLCLNSSFLLKTALKAAQDEGNAAAELLSWVMLTCASSSRRSRGAVRQQSAIQILEIPKESDLSESPGAGFALLYPAAVLVAYTGGCKSLALSLGEIFYEIVSQSSTIASEWVSIAGKALVLVLQLHEDDHDVGGDVLGKACSAAAALQKANRFSEATELLLALLAFSSKSEIGLILRQIGNETVSTVMKACIETPTPQHARLACALLQHSNQAGAALAEILHGGSLLAMLSSSSPVSADTPKKDKKKKKKDKKEKESSGADKVSKLAALLPPLTVYFEQRKKEREPRASEKKVDDVKSDSESEEDVRMANAGSDNGGGGIEGMHRQTASVILEELLGWLLDKTAAETDAECTALMHTWVIRCLTQVVPFAKPAVPAVLKALTALTKTEENRWSVETAALDTCTFHVATTREKAAAVDVLLKYILVERSALTASVLAPVASVFINTLAAVFKVKKPSSSQKAAESALLHLLDASLSDAVAALSISERAAPSFATLASQVCNDFGTAVLRRRAQDPVALKVLRRFAAALLPAEGSEDEEEEGGFVPNISIATAAAELFQKAVSQSHFLETMRNAAASPLPLPPAATALPLPLQSLLPLVEMNKTTWIDDHSSDTQERDEPYEGNASVSRAKRELCMLLETLLDVEEAFGPGAMRKKVSYSNSLAAAESALLPVVMAAYGGSLSAVDKAAWDLARSLNLRAVRRGEVFEYENSNGGGEDMQIDESQSSDNEDDDEAAAYKEEVQALLSGPLAQRCFAWGPAAVTAATTAASDPSPAHLQALLSKLHLDPLRCALLVTHFPESRALFGSFGSGGDVSLPSLPTNAAAYDPSFILPFCIISLRRNLISPRQFAQSGLASVCLRATAAEDAGLRALGYEAVGLLHQQIEHRGPLHKLQKPPSQPPAFGEAAEGISAAAEPAVADFKERGQLCSLLDWIRDALPSPFTRLPAVHAVFAAEAALLISHPAHSMFAQMSKARLKTATMDFSLVPLFRQTILSGSQEARIERLWLLRLLLSGLRSATDARVYLRQYIFELVMSLYDAAIVDNVAQKLCLGVITTACSVPRAARELTQRSGLIGWLASRAGVSAADALSAPSERAAASKFEDAVAAMRALQRLTALRAVVGGKRGSSRAIEDFAQACRHIVSILSGLSRGSGADLTSAQAKGLSELWVIVLDLCKWTASAADNSKIAFLDDEELKLAAAVADEVSAQCKPNT